MSKQQSKPLHIIILAAGEGTRMISELPKILQPLGGRPMLAHLLATARNLNPQQIHIVIGSQAEMVEAKFAGEEDLNWILQPERLGTGHAVQHALPDIPEGSVALILYGDHPLVPEADLAALLQMESAISLLTMVPPNSYGYGRILRDRIGRITGIVEQKDATETQLQITEVNTGMLAAPVEILADLLGQITNENAQQEYYLTDIFELAYDQSFEIKTVIAHDSADLQGANNRRQLASLERRYQYQQANKLMDAGVMLFDPARLDIRGEVSTGTDVCLDINVVLEGKVSLGDGVSIGPGSVLKNVRIGKGTKIEAHSVIEDAMIGNHCQIGPFARVRPGTELADEVKVGNFVEIKKSKVAKGSKASHLSYIGDSDIGRRVNIGAGTITCNYDGVNKFRTIIEDGAFIGSDTQLVAPVRIGKNATVGAGSTITHDVEAGTLAVSRARQSSIKSWQRPQKIKPEEQK